MAARLVAVADAFAAMLQPRPHRRPLSVEQAVDALNADTAAGRSDCDAAVAVLVASKRTCRTSSLPSWSCAVTTSGLTSLAGDRCRSPRAPVRRGSCNLLAEHGLSAHTEPFRVTISDCR
jgi:hypothetical protein